VRVSAARGYWVPKNSDVREFYLRVAPDDFAHVDRHVAYALVPKVLADDYVWKVKDGVTITRP
jgi:hypothetical protein